MSNIELKDVGPIERLDIALPESGICILRGKNGSGKSLALQAVQALAGGKARVPSRDGSLGATIEGLGARLTIGRRSTVSGEVEVATLEGEDPSLFADPGIKDPAACDAERVRALLRLARASVTPAAFAHLVGGEERLRELCREASLQAPTVPEMASGIKRDLEAEARKSEQAAENHLNKALGIGETLKTLGGADVKLESSANAREVHAAAIRVQARLKTQLELDGKLQRSADEARRALATLGDAGSTAIMQQHADRCTEVSASAQALRAKLEQAQAAVRLLENEVRNADGIATAAREALANQEQAATQRVSLEAVVNSAEGIVLVSDDDLARAEQAVQAASAEVDAWVLFDRTKNMREQQEAVMAEHRAAFDQGVKLRDAAKGTERVVLDAVRSVCGDDMALREGRLYVQTERGLELFTDLSHGERWRKALDIAVKAVGNRGLLVIRQEAFEALDPDNRKEIDDHAKRLGVVILTAEATDGELRAEVAAVA